MRRFVNGQRRQPQFGEGDALIDCWYAFPQRAVHLTERQWAHKHFCIARKALQLTLILDFKQMYVSNARRRVAAEWVVLAGAKQLAQTLGLPDAAQLATVLTNASQAAQRILAPYIS